VSWCFVLSLPKVRGGRLGDEVTSQTQAIQSIANITKTAVASHSALGYLMSGRSPSSAG
jgi:hypothetical protein